MNLDDKNAKFSKPNEKDVFSSILGGLFKISNEAIIVTDGRWNVICLNKRAEEIFGLVARDIIGTSIDSIFAKDQKEIAIAKFDNFAKSQNDSIDHTNSEYVLICSRENGAEFPMQTAIAKAQIGNSKFYTFMLRDLSARQHTLNELQTSQSRYKIAVRNAGLSILEIDYENNTVAFSKKYDVPFFDATTRDEARELALKSIVPEDYPTLIEIFHQFLETGAPISCELRFFKRDGDIMWLNIAGEAVKNAKGKITHFIGAFNDITEKRNHEEDLRIAVARADYASSAKSKLLAAVSHDLRTPLNGLLGMLNLVFQDDISQTARDKLEIAKKSGVELLNIVDDLLELDRIEKDEIALSNDQFKIIDLLEEAKNAHKSDARQKGLNINIDCLTSDIIIEGDRNCLKQILGKIVGNAVKYTFKGHIDIRAKYENGALEIIVQDTGIGMRPEVTENILNNFASIDLSTQNMFAGTGLGLAICNILVRKIGGTIDVKSELKVGTTIQISAPLRAISIDNDWEVAKTNSDEVEDINPEDLNVLVAEDNLTNQLVIKALLEAIGIHPTIVGDGKQAIDMWRDHEYNIILMDIKMPILDGLSATKTIRDLEAKAHRHRTPIVAVTANALPEQVNEYISSGMDGCVTKPLAAPVLYSAIESALFSSEDEEGGEGGEVISA